MKLFLFTNIFLLSFLEILSYGNSGKHLTWVVASTSPDLDAQEPSGYYKENFTYLARGAYKDEFLCGQYHPETKTFLSSFKGQEVTVKELDKIQVLTFQPNVLSWIARGNGDEASDGDSEVPSNLLLCGSLPETGEHLFPCRAIKDSVLMIGYFRFTTNNCVFPHNNGESEASQFEILVTNYYGIYTEGAYPLN